MSEPPQQPQQAVPADLQPERIATLLHSARFGRSLRVLPDTDSTNDDARADARAGAPDGHVVVADGQRAGRGSSGRDWASPAGSDLYLSIVARPRLSLSQLPPLTLAVGLGVADAVAELLAAYPGAPAPEVKWPNDVWLAGRKCAGILLEAESSGSVSAAGAGPDAGEPPAPAPVVLGIGLNVNRERFPPELGEGATSLRLSARASAPLDRALALSVLLLHVERWVDRFVTEGGAAVSAALQPRLALRGEVVTCGGQRGTLVGVAPSGALRLSVDGQLRELISGRIARV